MGSNPSKRTGRKSYAEVAEWKTRLTQNQVSERACGFESHLRYVYTRQCAGHDVLMEKHIVTPTRHSSVGRAAG